MGPYTHKEIRRIGHIVIENAKGWPVAMVEKNELSVSTQFREKRSDIEAYCKEKKLCTGVIKQRYCYQRGDSLYIIKKKARELTVMIYPKKAAFPAMVAGEENFVRDACIKVGIWPECKGKYSHIYNEVMDENEERTIAVIEDGIFTLVDKEADEEDVRLYCMTEGIFFS